MSGLGIGLIVPTGMVIGEEVQCMMMVRQVGI